MIMDGANNQIMQGGAEIIRLFQFIREEAQAFRDDCIQDYVRIRNGGGGTQGTELKLVARKGKG